MKVLDAAFVQGFIRMTEDGWKQGWHERNGGNLSYRIKDEEVEAVKENFVPREWTPIGKEIPSLAGEYFLVTGSGKYFRNVVLDPEANISIIELDEKGENYRILWGMRDGGRPTSELPSHLMNLAALKERDPEIRVVYHCHPANTVALTFVLPLDDEVFTREIFEMVSECAVVFPEGIGIVPWAVPGSIDIAEKTAEIMKTQDVAIWAAHGAFACGTDFDIAFGLMHTVEKAAEILVKVRSMTDVKANPITPEQLRSLNDQFGIKINERFLYERTSNKIGER